MIIATVKTDFPTKFGIPRQSGLVEELKGTIIFEPEFRNPDALRGLEEFSHLWIIWEFSECSGTKWSPTVRPPKLGGNTRVGVFATRSPFRPNSMGLSCVKIDSIEYTEKYGPLIHISGVDMMNNTPVLDIKPYIPYADSHPQAKSGFSKDPSQGKLTVDFPERLQMIVPEGKRAALIKVLELDPRPSYQDDPDRVYGLSFANTEIKFSVINNTLYVTETSPSTHEFYSD